MASDAFARDFDDLFGAGLLAAHEIERVTNFGEVEVRSGGADDDVVVQAIHFDLLILRAIFGGVLLGL